MVGKRTGRLLALAAVFLIPFPAHADQIAPNPNSGTIIVRDPNAYNGESPFVNNGAIEIEGAGILTNGLAAMTNNGTLNNSGTLDNFQSTLSNSGALNNSGVFNNGASQITNTGILNNSGSMSDGEFTLDNHGAFSNTGSMKNADSTVNNSGAMNNFGVMTCELGGIYNTGSLKNTGRILFSGGPTSLGNSGTLNNSGAMTFSEESNLNNSGTLNNTGVLVNNVLFGINNSGTIRNSAAITGTGGYTQTAGATVNDGGMTQSSVNIQGGSLSGTGTITGNVNLGSAATLAPGDPAGTLTINGNLISSGNLLFQIGGLGNGQFSVLKISGNAVFSGGSIDFSFINGFNPTAGEYWYFLNAAGISWNALDFQVGGLANGLGWGVDLTGAGARLSITGANSVPEPSTLMLLTAGLLSLMFLAPRNRNGRQGR